MTHLMNNYARLPVTFVRGQGCYLYDRNGKAYLDAIAGIAVCGLGHAHPELVQTLNTQAQNLWHTSNLFTISAQEEAAERLSALTGMEKVYFCNSGTEANEAAIKLARLHARAKHIEQPVIITFNGSFHGRTFGSMSATANPKIREGFTPLVPGFVHLPYNDMQAVARYLSEHSAVVAVMLETIQGEGGIQTATPEFLTGLRRLCDEYDLLLIIDEIQTGMARTGAFLSYQHYGFLPDVTTMAKALGNGLPVGATLARGKAATYFCPGKHGSTFGGSPLICSVVNQILTIYARDNPAEAARLHGEYLKQQLEQLCARSPNILNVRGQGLMLGIELAVVPDNLLQRALALGLIINLTAGNVIRLLPPLIINREQTDEIIATLNVLLTQSIAESS